MLCPFLIDILGHLVLEEHLEKLSPGSDRTQWDGGGEPVILDSQMGLRFNPGSDQAATLHLFVWLKWTLTFFFLEVYFSILVTFGNYFYSWPVGWSHFMCVFWHPYLNSVLMVINQPCLSTPNLKYTILRKGLLLNILSRKNWKEECSLYILISPILTY